MIQQDLPLPEEYNSKMGLKISKQGKMAADGGEKGALCLHKVKLHLEQIQESAKSSLHGALGSILHAFFPVSLHSKAAERLRMVSPAQINETPRVTGSFKLCLENLSLCSSMSVLLYSATDYADTLL